MEMFYEKFIHINLLRLKNLFKKSQIIRFKNKFQFLIQGLILM